MTHRLLLFFALLTLLSHGEVSAQEIEFSKETFNRKAIMIVPQCPTDKAWLGSTQDVLVALLKTYIDRGVVDVDKVYIFGGSRGGELAHGVCSPTIHICLPPRCLS